MGVAQNILRIAQSNKKKNQILAKIVLNTYMKKSRKCKKINILSMPIQQVKRHDMELVGTNTTHLMQTYCLLENQGGRIFEIFSNHAVSQKWVLV